MNFDYNKSTVYLTVVGSQSYGLSTPESDVDVKGVAIPPTYSKLGFYSSFAQKDSWGDVPEVVTNTDSEFCAEVKKNPPVDRVVYDLAKFVKLAADCNPNMIEVLFTDERFHLFRSPIFERLMDVRDEFVSKKCFNSFQGYALSQLSRIKVAKKWLDNPPDHQPTREEFGLPATQKTLDRSMNGAFNKLFAEMLEVSGKFHEKREFVSQFMDQESPDFVDWIAMVQKLSDRNPGVLTLLEDEIAEAMDLKPQLMRVINREKMYGAALKEWQDFKKWEAGRNPKRAELERKFGYDTKHGMHLCRLVLMCREMLDGRGVKVYRDEDGDFLRGVRAGSMPYDDLLVWCEEQREDLRKAYEVSTLPKLPDMKLLQKVCVEMYEEFYYKN